MSGATPEIPCTLLGFRVQGLGFRSKGFPEVGKRFHPNP